MLGYVVVVMCGGSHIVRYTFANLSIFWENYIYNIGISSSVKVLVNAFSVNYLEDIVYE